MTMLSCLHLYNLNGTLRNNNNNNSNNNSNKRPLLVSRTLVALLLLYALAASSILVAYYNVTVRSLFTSRTKSPPKVVFVHPGKTGGTSLGHFLRLFCQVRNKPDSREHCFQQFQQSHMSHMSMSTTSTSTGVELAESKVSEYTQGGIHVDWIYPDSVYLRRASHFLISVRNPMERVMSWFYFMHPINCYQEHGKSVPRQKFALIDKACITKGNMEERTNSREYLFYKTCFPQVEQFVQAIAPDNKAIPRKCVEVAKAQLQGEGGPNGMAGHLWSNYVYYANLSTRPYPHKTVLVARTEFLWQDLARIDRDHLGGTGEAFQNQWEMDNNNNKATAVAHYHKDKLSSKGYQILCCAIQEEVAVYQEWLQAAANLSHEEKQDSLQQVLNQCFGDNTDDNVDSSDATAKTKHNHKQTRSLEDLAEHCMTILPNS